MLLTFFLIDQDEGVFQGGHHLLGIGHEVGRQVASIKLHTLNNFKGCFHTFGFFNGDDPFFANLVHGLGDDVTDGFIIVRRNGADLGNVTLILGGLAQLLEFFDNDFNRGIYPPFNGHGIIAGRHQFLPLFINSSGQKRSRGCTITGRVTCFAGYLLDHLGAHVLELVFQFDLLGNGNAVFGNRGGTPGFVDDHVSALGA
jgi:hypothetical protein